VTVTVYFVIHRRFVNAQRYKFIFVRISQFNWICDMEQLTMMTTEERDRCATANCNGTVKKLTFLGGCMKWCGLCDTRGLFRRIVKCTGKMY